jgi:hypothetical protein
MPFTASHAVVALPFLRTRLVPSAIAVGAMTPDLPLFLRGTGVSYGFTHGVENVVWTALLASVLFAVWRFVLRPAVPQLLPRLLAVRLPAEWSRRGIRSWRDVLGVGRRRTDALWLALSLVIGVLSHIAWDLFTHEGRGGVMLIPALDRLWGPLPGYKWLQYGSSVAGLAIIALWAALRLRRAVPGAPPSRVLPSGVVIAWWCSLPVILMVAWIVGVVAFGPFTAAFTPHHLAYRVLPPACAVWGALTLVLCLSMPLFARPHHRG